MVNETHEPKVDAALEQRSRELFNTQVASQPAHMRSRLNQARQMALRAAHEATHSAWGLRGWVPLGSAAALALVALTVVQIMRPGAENTSESGPLLAASVDDVEILTADTELEMLQNMEFYAWLTTEPEGAVAESASEAG